MLKKLLFLTILFVTLVQAPVLLAGLESPGSFLLLGHGARGPGLASAVVARPEGVLASRYNPAGLARVDTGQFEAGFQDLVMGVNQGSMDLVKPAEKTGRGFSLSYLDYGSEKRVEISPSGEPVAAGSFESLDLSLGYLQGWRAGRGPDFEWFWGAGGRLVRLDVAGASDRTIAGEVGVLGLARDGSYQVGGVIRNLGPGLSLDSTEESLPRVVRAGLSSLVYNDDRYELTVNAELELREMEDFSEFLSAELQAGRHLSLRTGYDGRVDAGAGWRAGFGLENDGRRFDYAYLPLGDLGNSHRLAVRFEF